ncbi:MAG: hypothetical protein WBQ20_02210, partial [Methyloceanibacter sp.]
ATVHAAENPRKMTVVSFGLFGDEGVFRREATGAVSGLGAFGCCLGCGASRRSIRDLFRQSQFSNSRHVLADVYGGLLVLGKCLGSWGVLGSRRSEPFGPRGSPTKACWLMLTRGGKNPSGPNGP